MGLPRFDRRGRDDLRDEGIAVLIGIAKKPNLHNFEATTTQIFLALNAWSEAKSGAPFPPAIPGRTPDPIILRRAPANFFPFTLVALSTTALDAYQ